MPLAIGNVPPQNVHLGEVGSDASGLVTSGLYGWTAVVTGTGATIEDARAQAYRHASEIQSPNLRYRLDIGQKLIAGDLDRLSEWGWLNAIDRRMASQIVR